MIAQGLDFAAYVMVACLDLAYQLLDGAGAADYMVAFFIVFAVSSLIISPMRGRSIGFVADYTINKVSASNQKVVNRAAGRQMRSARNGRPYRAGKGTYEH